MFEVDAKALRTLTCKTIQTPTCHTGKESVLNTPAHILIVIIINNNYNEEYNFWKITFVIQFPRFEKKATVSQIT